MNRYSVNITERVVTYSVFLLTFGVLIGVFMVVLIRALSGLEPQMPLQSIVFIAFILCLFIVAAIALIRDGINKAKYILS
jgi:hypothetical protein